MKRALYALISLYPKPWRNRYKNEFCALLDDVSPTWRMLVDVFGGALKMQMKIWSPWKIIPAFAVAGVVLATAFSLAVPDRYVSTAVIKIGDGQRRKMAATRQLVESRWFLSKLINEGDLYKGERSRLPLEDVVERMKSKDLAIYPVNASGVQAFAVSFTSTDAGQAQRTAQRLASQFVDAHVGEVLDPASLPVHPQNPRRSRIILMGLFAGLVVGVLFALFNGLRVWKIGGGLGIAGAIAGAAVAFVLPERFVSTAVISVAARSGAWDRISQIVAAVKSDASLRETVQRFNLYPNESGRERRLAEHLHIETVSNGPAIVIRFDDRDRFVAQKVVRDIERRLMAEDFNSNIRLGSREDHTLEWLDPATLPQNAYFPNRPMVVETGFFIGLAGAIMLGVWRHFKRSFPVVAV
jgi:capsular polysaccharide biosynthesis protein